MAHPTGGKWTAFVNASTALKELEKCSHPAKNYSGQLPLNLTGSQAHNFYTDLTQMNSTQSFQDPDDEVEVVSDEVVVMSDGIEVIDNDIAVVNDGIEVINDDIEVINDNIKVPGDRKDIPGDLKRGPVDSDLKEVAGDGDLKAVPGVRKDNIKEVLGDRKVINDDIVELITDGEEDDDDIKVISEAMRTNSENVNNDDIEVVMCKKKARELILVIDGEKCVIPLVTASGTTQSSSESDFMPQFWCEICKKSFKENKLVHNNSIVHQFNINESRSNLNTPNFFIPPNNKGYQMLLALGWDQTKGLGKEGDGPKYPVKTVLKLDRSGLGQEVNTARVSHFKHDNNLTVRSMYERKRKTQQPQDKETGWMGRHKRRGMKDLSADRKKEILIRKELDMSNEELIELS